MYAPTVVDTAHDVTLDLMFALSGVCTCVQVWAPVSTLISTIDDHAHNQVTFSGVLCLLATVVIRSSLLSHQLDMSLLGLGDVCQHTAVAMLWPSLSELHAVVTQRKFEPSSQSDCPSNVLVTSPSPGEVRVRGYALINGKWKQHKRACASGLDTVWCSTMIENIKLTQSMKISARDYRKYKHWKCEAMLSKSNHNASVDSADSD